MNETKFLRADLTDLNLINKLLKIYNIETIIEKGVRSYFSIVVVFD